VAAAAPGAALAGTAERSLRTRLRASDQARERLGEYPLDGLVRRFREDQTRGGTATGRRGAAAT